MSVHGKCTISINHMQSVTFDPTEPQIAYGLLQYPLDEGGSLFDEHLAETFINASLEHS